MNKTFPTIKSSITIVVLFCFVAICQASGTICVNDTIIIDGKKVVVERVVDYETEKVEDPEPAKTKVKPERRHTPYLGIGAGPSFLLVNAEVVNPDFMTLNQFVDSEGKFRTGARAHATFGMKWEKWALEISPSLDLNWYKNHYFTESSLDDSLFQFETTESGVLNQITRHDLVIGVEFYDVEATLLKSSILMTNFHLPVNLVYHHKLDRTNHLEFRVGAGPFWNISKQGGPIVIMNETDYQYFDVSNFETQLGITGFIGVDWAAKPSHRVETYRNIGVWFSPAFSPHFVDNPVYNQTVTQFGVRVSFNFFSKKNSNKVAQ